MDNDTPGVADRTLNEIRTWPPGLPIFGLLTPLPATPLYKGCSPPGRLTRPSTGRSSYRLPWPNAPEDDHRGSAREVKHGLGPFLQPEAMAHAVGSPQGPASGLIASTSHRSHCVSGNLLPAEWFFRMAETPSTKIAAPFSACSGEGFSTWLHPPRS